MTLCNAHVAPNEVFFVTFVQARRRFLSYSEWWASDRRLFGDKFGRFGRPSCSTFPLDLLNHWALKQTNHGIRQHGVKTENSGKTVDEGRN